VRAAGPVTLGVEEEFVLLDPATGDRHAGPRQAQHDDGLTPQVPQAGRQAAARHHRDRRKP
jgi:hypothetical protein